MIKSLLILVFSSIYLFGAGFWTLTGLEKANIYINNEVVFLKKVTIDTIKSKMVSMLKKEGIKTKQQDSPTLMLALKSIENDENSYVYVKLALGEEVQTFRKDKSRTFALTYDSNDFIETDKEEIDHDILESVDFLLSQFKEQLEDDRE